MSSKSTVKDTAINAAVWTLSAAVVLGIGTWIWKRAKRTVIKEQPESNQMQAPQSMANAYLAGNPWAMQPQMQTPMMAPMMQMPMYAPATMQMAPQQGYADMIPAALQMQPNLQSGAPGMRRRRANTSEPPPWFQSWAAQQSSRMDNLERKLEESYEDFEEVEE